MFKKLLTCFALTCALILTPPYALQTHTAFSSSVPADTKNLSIAQKYAADALSSITHQKTFSTYLGSRKYNEKMRSLLLKQVSGSSKVTMNIYVATENGNFVLAPNQPLPDGYDPRVRPWYETVKSTKKVYTESYVDAVTQELITTYSKPLFNHSGKFVGVISIDYFPYRLKGNPPPKFSPQAANAPVSSSHYTLKNVDSDFLQSAVEKIKQVAQNSDLPLYIKKNDTIGCTAYLLQQSDTNTKLAYFAKLDGNLYLSKKIEVAPHYDPRERIWYQDALSKDPEVYSEIYTDPETSRPMLTLAIAVHEHPLFLMKKGELLGVLAMDFEIPLDKIK